MVDSEWLTPYCVLALEWDSPIVEVLSAYWIFVRTMAKRLSCSADPAHYRIDLGLTLTLLSHSGMGLAQIPNPTPQMCWIAVGTIGHAIRHVPDKTPDLCMRAVRSTPVALADIPIALHTYEICLAAVEKSGLALEYVDYDMKIARVYLCDVAVRQNGMALQYVPEKVQTPELRMAAVLNAPLAMRFVPAAWPELYVAAALGNLLKAQRTLPPHPRHVDITDLLRQITTLAQALQ